MIKPAVSTLKRLLPSEALRLILDLPSYFEVIMIQLDVNLIIGQVSCGSTVVRTVACQSEGR